MPSGPAGGGRPRLRGGGGPVPRQAPRRPRPRPVTGADRAVTLALRWGAPLAVVVACIGYLIYSAAGGAAEYYLTVSELRGQAPAGDVRVAGVVQDDVQRTGGGLHVTFTEKDAT